MARLRLTQGALVVFVVLVSRSPAQAQPPTPCPLIEDVFVTLIECMSAVFPNPNHPLYAPIIGGADMDFAKDMCQSESWRDGLNCVIRITEECIYTPKLANFLRAMYPPDVITRGVQRFCSRLDEYQKHVECYFEHREVLRDCYYGAYNKWYNFYRNNMDAPVSVWIQNSCSSTAEGVGCQVDGMRRFCSRDAGDFLDSSEKDFTPPACGATSIHVTMATVTFLFWVVKLFLF